MSAPEPAKAASLALLNTVPPDGKARACGGGPLSPCVLDGHRHRDEKLLGLPPIPASLLVAAPQGDDA